MTTMSQSFISLPGEPKWGPTGKDVYDRTYSRTKADGTKESWADTVKRVVDGNLALVPERFIDPKEREQLYEAIYNFHILPAGRHLWMSGVEGRQFLFNCYVSGWTDNLSDHFTFTFNQLMEGGGVGSNYSWEFVNPEKYPIARIVEVHIVCSDEHDDHSDLYEDRILSQKYTADCSWAYEVEDSREGWANALNFLIESATIPVDDVIYTDDPFEIVFDVSNIRAAGKRIKTFGGTSAGPVPLAKLLKLVGLYLIEAWASDGMDSRIAMEIDHAIAACVVSGNVRRSARMSIMKWDDPNIEWFLSCKEDGFRHWSTNISVEIDDEFIDLVSETREGTRKHGYDAQDTQIRRQKALAVFSQIVEGMLRNGEPGIWNSSLSNQGEPNRVISTNPCGEICLEGFENCNLGHVNLDAFVDRRGSVDESRLFDAHRLMTRFLMRATYGDISDPRTKEIVDRNRRIGVGHFGFAGFLAKQGIRFSDSWTDDQLEQLLYDLHSSVNATAEDYAHMLRIPVPVKTTTVAPTGTIAKLAGRSEGIHPVYARYFIRRIRYSMIDPDQAARVEEFRAIGYNVVEDVYTPNTWVVEIPTKEALVEELEELGIDPEILESANEINLEDLIAVQAMYQECYANNAVSFTMNIPEGKYSIEEVMKILLPYLSKVKGTTIMVDESRELAPYERMGRADFEAQRGSQVDSGYDEECASGACSVR